MAPTLMLLDAASLYFRAFYGVPDSVTAPDGRPANALRGFIDFMARLTAEHRPGGLVACWDADWRPAFRVDLLPSYKAHRVVEATDEEEVPDALAPQVEAIAAFVDAFGIARAWADGFEADDVIGTLTARHPGPVDIVTGDRDLFQLVDDSRPVRVLYTARGVRAAEVVDEAAVTARFDIPGRSYAAFAALRGDPSDGLPGVKGVGAKTAAAIVQRYPTLDLLLAAVDARSDDVAALSRLVADREYLGVAGRVVDVVTDVPVHSIDPSLPRRPRDPAAVAALIAEWGIAGPVERLTAAIRSTTAQDNEP